LLRQLSGFECRHLSKIQIGRHKQRSCPPESIKNFKKIFYIHGIFFFFRQLKRRSAEATITEATRPRKCLRTDSAADIAAAAAGHPRDSAATLAAADFPADLLGVLEDTSLTADLMSGVRDPVDGESEEQGLQQLLPATRRGTMVVESDDAGMAPDGSVVALQYSTRENPLYR
jgi:hypothetical protein